MHNAAAVNCYNSIQWADRISKFSEQEMDGKIAKRDAEKSGTAQTV